MNRRAFLGWLGGTAAGVAASHVLDLDRLLWVPGERTIFVPASRPLLTMISPSWVTRDVVLSFRNSLLFMQHFRDGEIEIWNAETR